MTDPDVGHLLAAAFVLLFGQSALHKWRGLAEFSAVLRAYRLMPNAVVPAFAPIVPAVETALVFTLLPTATRPVAAAIGVLLLIGYAFAMALNLQRGRRDLDCGCTGPADRRPIAAWMVWRNLMFAAALALALLPAVPRPLEATDLLTLLGGLAVITTLYTALDRLFSQLMPRTAALRAGR